MEAFESQFAELSFKVCKLKVSLRIKRPRIMCQDVAITGNGIQEEINPRAFGSSSYDSSPEFLSRRSSISSVDSGYDDTPSTRSILNSVSSEGIKKTKQISKSSVVNADEDFERYFQPI